LSTSITGDGRYVKYNGSTGWYMFQSGGSGAWVTGTVPTGTWYAASNMPTLTNPSTTGYQPNVGVYNGKVYYPSTLNGTTGIRVISDTYPTYTAATSVSYVYPTIFSPNTISTLAVDGSKLFVGDDAGRVYSATLT
jgi:hypothetical protein